MGLYVFVNKGGCEEVDGWEGGYWKDVAVQGNGGEKINGGGKEEWGGLFCCTCLLIW